MQAIRNTLSHFLRRGLGVNHMSNGWTSTSSPPLSTVSNVHMPLNSQFRGLSTLLMSANGGLLQVTSPILISIRTNVRNHFPRPKESMRMRKHGWKKRMSTANGRLIIMRRILKGRHALTH